MGNTNLLGYAEGFFQTACQLYRRNFIKEVGTNLILFRSHEGIFFQQHYEDEESFNAKVIMENKKFYLALGYKKSPRRRDGFPSEVV